MVAAYACGAILGWAVLETGIVAGPVGWFAIGFGLVAGTGFVSGLPRTPFGPLFEPPLLVHIVPFVLALALVW